MKKTIAPFLRAGTALVLSMAGAVLAGTVSQSTLAKWDAGPSFINVSHYPKSIQQDYQLFSQKCSQCHHLSRPINSNFALPDDWSRYIKRMMFKPGSNISPAQAKKIYEFLVYDASVRKKALLDKKLAKLAPKQKAKELAKIRQVYRWCGANYSATNFISK